MTALHSLHAAALAAAAPKPEPIDNTDAVSAFRAEGGHILHQLPQRLGDGTRTRGVTFAFKLKGGRVQIATSVQHRADIFTKKVGTKTALEHFAAGQVITLPTSAKKVSQVANYLSWLAL